MAAIHFVTIALKGGETFDLTASAEEAGAMIAAWDDFLDGSGPAVLAAPCAEGQGQVRVLMSEIAAMVTVAEESDDDEDDADEDEDEDDEDGDDEDGDDEDGDDEDGDDEEGDEEGDEDGDDEKADEPEADEPDADEPDADDDKRGAPESAAA